MSAFTNQLDEMAEYVNHLRSKGLKAPEAINLLGLILNYNITVRQMGITGTAPVAQKEKPSASQH